MSTVRETLQRAVDRHRAGDLDAARRLYRTALDRDPSQPEAWHLLGVAAHQQGRHADAVEAIRRAIAVDPSVPAYHGNLGNALRALGRLDEAVVCFRESIRRAPEYAPGHYNLGLACEALGRADESEREYAAAIAADPRFAEAHNALGNRLLSSERIAAAVECFERATSLAPRSAGFRFNFGNALRRAGRLNEAAVALTDAIALDPNDAGAHNNLGTALRELDRLDEAVAAFRRAIELAPEDGEAVANLGSALQSTGRYDEAFDLFRRAASLRPDDPAVRCELARELVRRDRIDDAIAEYQETLRRHPQHAPAHLALGHVLFRTGRLDEARERFEAGIAIDPNTAGAWRALSQLRGLQADVEGAIEAARRAVDLEPDDRDSLLHLGSALLYAARPDKAREFFRRVVELRPDDAAGWNLLGTTHLLSGDAAEAEACFRRTLEATPNEPQACSQLGEIARNRGDLDEAARRFSDGFDSPLGDRLRLQDAFLLPILYDSPQDLLDWRERFLTKVDGLLERGLRYDAARGLVPTTFYLGYQGLDERETLERVNRLFVSSHEPRPSRREPNGDDRIRVGFASHHLYSHTIGCFNAGLIERLDRRQFHVTLLSTLHRDDDMARGIRASADRYVVLTEDPAVAHRLVADLELDAIFYPDLGMDPTTLSLAHSRLAPVQCVTWGHPLTTGLPTIDAFLSSELIEVDDADSHYTERLVRLTGLPTFYRRPGIVGRAKSRSELGLPEGVPLYACPQTLFKFHPDFDPLLAAILRTDRRGHLAMIGSESDPWVRRLTDRWRRTLGEECVERVHFTPRLSGPDFLSLMATADVLLDPLHFGGGNTVYQGLSLGTPIVTWPSRFLRGRCALGASRKIDVLDCVANSAAEYVDLALRVAGNRDFREHVRGRILQNVDRLFEDAVAVREIEEYLVRSINSSEQGPRVATRGLR